MSTGELSEDRVDELDLKEVYASIEDESEAMEAASLFVQAFTAANLAHFALKSSSWGGWILGLDVQADYDKLSSKWRVQAGLRARTHPSLGSYSVETKLDRPPSIESIHELGTGIFAEVVVERDRRDSLIRLCRAIRAASEQDDSFESRMDGLDHAGRTGIYLLMTPADIAYWFGVLRRLGH